MNARKALPSEEELRLSRKTVLITCVHVTKTGCYQKVLLCGLLREGGFHVNVGEKSVFPLLPAPLSTCVGPLHFGPSTSLQNT